MHYLGHEHSHLGILHYLQGCSQKVLSKGSKTYIYHILFVVTQAVKHQSGEGVHTHFFSSFGPLCENLIVILVVARLGDPDPWTRWPATFLSINYYSHSHDQYSS